MRRYTIVVDVPDEYIDLPVQTAESDEDYFQAETEEAIAELAIMAVREKLPMAITIVDIKDNDPCAYGKCTDTEAHAEGGHDI